MGSGAEKLLAIREDLKNAPTQGKPAKKELHKTHHCRVES
jgi:hypothetical protein